MTDFSHIDTFVFDLDNTLYPADCNLFAQIDARMEIFVAELLSLPPQEARRIQKQYYAEYGTTLSGLMREHGVQPRDFLDYVHDIDLAPVSENARLKAALSSLPGRRYIFTNGSVRHAENVAAKIGILDLFDGIFDIAAADYLPKPHVDTYHRFNAHFGITPERAAMFEDLPQNLVAAHDLGKTTVLVQADAAWAGDEPEGKRPSRPGETYPHVHHVTSDLTSFLAGLTTPA